MVRYRFAGAVSLALSLSLFPFACGGDPFSVGPAGQDAAGGDTMAAPESSSQREGGSREDGSGDDVAQHEAGSDGPTFLEGGPIEAAPPPSDGPHEAAPGNIVYVSSSVGDDMNDGTDRTKPKKTIAAALARAQTIATPEVHVCKGIYKEQALSLTPTINLRGSYDCTSWQQTYVYPKFDTTNLSTIENADATVQAATLLVTGAVGSAVIDGFSIAGASMAGATTYGVRITGTATAILQNDSIAGGGGNGSTGSPGSIGISIEGGSPELLDDKISGGTGTGSPGSIGIDVASGSTPNIHHLVVSGGTGGGASTAAIGIRVAATLSQTTHPLAEVVVTGSESLPMVMGSTIGIQVAGKIAAADIMTSAILGGYGMGAGATSVGVDVRDGAGTVRLLYDELYGGQQSAGGATYGVYANGAGVLEIANSEIHAGTTSGTAVGVDIVAAQAASIAYTTIYVGANAGGGAGGTAIAIEAGVQNVGLEDDLLLGANGGSNPAVSVSDCTGGQLAMLDHVAFVNFGTLYACGGTGGMMATIIPMLTTLLPSLPTLGGDIEIGSGAACTMLNSCVSDPSCPAAPAMCIPSILGASFTTSPAGDDGVTGLFHGAAASGADGGLAEAGLADGGMSLSGWSLPPATLCALAQGGTPIGKYTKDLFGQPRDPSTPTIGAVEYTTPPCAK
jgi:hypothetical protein